jgi:hypothetical protein
LNLQAESSPVFEQINGHSCRKTEAAVTLSNGSTARFFVWRASDLKRFPMRIESAGGAPKLTLTFSEVVFKSFENELFQPPAGFTRYPSTDVMTTELVVRTAAMKKPVQGGMQIDRPIDTGYDNMQTGGPHGRQ